MLSPRELDRMPDAFVALWQQVEDEILRDAARRIAKTGKLTETANWQLWRYQQTEAVRQKVVKLLAQYTGKSESTIRRLLKAAATEALEREDEIYYHYGKDVPPFEDSAALNNLLTAGAAQTNGTWQNLTATTANTVSGAFERTLDTAWGKVSTGAFDYNTAIRQDSARISVAGFGHSAASKAAWAAKTSKRSDSGIVLQKLNFAENIPHSERESVEKELSVLPQWQREKAESIIDNVVVVSIEASGSGYYYPTRTLYLHPERSSGDVIHEYGHILEISLDLIHNEKYLSVRAHGINIDDPSQIDDDETTFTEQAWILNNSKFISRYQGRMYNHVGILDDGKIVLDSLMDYFSEGYRAYYQTPDLLVEKDPELYNFIGGLENDEG